MLIAQITDIHLGFEPGNPQELNRLRLDRTLERLCAMEPRPDVLLCTGDLTDRGDVESFRRLREALAPLPFPCFLAVGNHDERGPLFEVFPETRTVSGFVQYAIEDWPLRILVLDTLEHGRHAGAFGASRARWLTEEPDRPTLIVLHHPPAFTGIDWMTLAPEETWAARLTAIVAGRPNIVGAIAGHLHRPAVASWAGTCLRVCSSVAPQVTLELKPLDLDHPDGRPLVQAEPPAFALHHWAPETGLITHFGRVEEVETLIRYDERFQPVLRRFAEERTQEPADSPVEPDPVLARKRSGWSLFGLRRRPAASTA
jgi:Icc protein